MKTTTVLLTMIIALLFSAPVAFGQRVPAEVDQNAAVRYLMAMGWFSPPDSHIMTELAGIEHLEDVKKLSPEALKYLKTGKANDFGVIGNVIELMKAGAKCSTCVFNPDKKYLPTDFIPPYRRLREMARTLRAIGALQALDGKHQEALDLFKTIYRFGQHMGLEGPLISGMIGVAFQKMALGAMTDLRAMNPAETIIVDMKSFLKAAPRPPMNVPLLIQAEKNFFENGSKWARENPEGFGTDFKLVKTATGTTIAIATDEPGKSSPQTPSSPKTCSANQRVLMGALEMLGMDYGNPLPASISADLKGTLVKLQYLKKFPECYEKGEYSIDLSGKGDPIVSCSVHKTVDAIQTSTKPVAPEKQEGAPSSKPKACAANQRVLLGAMEMLQMDYEAPLPATISANLQEALVTMLYLKSFPECPEKGQYSIELLAKGGARVSCTVHKTIDDMEEAAAETAATPPSPKESAEWKAYANSPDFERLIAEGVKLYDVFLKLDSKSPDFQKTLDKIMADVENSANPLIKIWIPNFGKVWKNQKDLETEIEKLLK